MPLVIVAGGVALLLLLMIRFKLNGFISLVLVALAVGIAQGMPVDKVIGSIKAGVGGTLGSLAAAAPSASPLRLSRSSVKNTFNGRWY